MHNQKHLDDELSLDDLAAIARFSPFHFHRVFRGMFGDSVKEHVRRLQPERAAHRLKCSDEQVVRLALDAGYEAHESFTRAFAAMFGASPSEFRKTHRTVAYPPSPSNVHFAANGELESLNLQPPGETAVIVRIENVPRDRIGQFNSADTNDTVSPTVTCVSLFVSPLSMRQVGAD